MCVIFLNSKQDDYSQAAPTVIAHKQEQEKEDQALRLCYNVYAITIATKNKLNNTASPPTSGADALHNKPVWY